MASAEGKRTERFSEKSLNLENSLKSEVRLPSSERDTSVTKVTNNFRRVLHRARPSWEVALLKSNVVGVQYTSEGIVYTLVHVTDGFKTTAFIKDFVVMQ